MWGYVRQGLGSRRVEAREQRQGESLLFTIASNDVGGRGKLKRFPEHKHTEKSQEQEGSLA